MFWVEKMIIDFKENSYSVFPQANDIYRVIAYVSTFVNKSDLYKFNFLKEEITLRQIHYYKSAAEYLGLIEDNKPTDLTKTIFGLDKNQLLINIMQIILSNVCFYDFFKEQNEEKAIEYLINRYSFSNVTAKRRLSTIKAWCKWCKVITKENNIIIE